MPNRTDQTQVLAAARHLLARPGRQIMAIAGAPGSGKSTLAEQLSAAINADTPGLAAVLPMDGFHFDDAVLHERGRRPWKGAPDTFDVDGLRNTLHRLRTAEEGAVAVPVFDRDLEISRGSARIIPPDVQLVIAEGNYLLLDQAPWNRLWPLFDLSVFVSVPEAELRRRLALRWQGYGLSEADIDFKLDQNDLPNGRAIIAGSRAADLTLRFGDEG